MSDKLIEKVVQVESDLDERLLRQTADLCGATIRKGGVRAPDPTSWLLIVGGSALIVGTVIERWQDRRQGGQVIDLRPGADPVLRRDPDVVFGYVVILLPDGRVDVQLREPEHQLATLVTHLVDAFGPDQLLTDRVVEITRDLVDDATIAIERSTADAEDS